MQLTKNAIATTPRSVNWPTRILHLWHLLSLDAPTVATFWTWFVARCSGLRLPLAGLAAMFLAVWILYAADRILDARHLFTDPLHTQDLEARHLFHHRHATAFLNAILIGSIALAAILRDLLPEALRLYAILAALLCGWFLLIHARAAAALRLPKEIAVGIFFPAAIFIPTVARHPELRLALLPHALLFSAVCTLNCLAIYAWEHSPPYTNAHWTTRHAIRHLSTIATLTALVGLALAAATHHTSRWPMALAASISAAILLALHEFGCPIHAVPSHEWAFAERTALPSQPQDRHLNPLTLRAAADLALLPPLPLLLLLTKTPRPTQPNFDRIARPYRYLEYLTLGATLQNCRTHHLPKLLHQKSALVLGDGDGRFLAQLLRANPTLQAEAVDTSRTMLDLLETRCKPEAARLQTHQTSALTFTPTRTYDLITTHFFLDCLTQSDVEALIQNLTPALEPDALWLVSDFRIPTGLLRLPAKLYVRSLYLAFRVLTGLRTTALPDHATPLANAGFTLLAEHRSLAGLLTTQLWQRSSP